VAAGYELERQHLEVLREVCRLLDRQNALEAAVRRDGEVVRGSTGQPRLHPALAESRQTALAVARLLDVLGLDADVEEPETATTRKARAAAQARWGVVHQLERRRGAS
jgi:hypothetical protein